MLFLDCWYFDRETADAMLEYFTRRSDVVSAMLVKPVAQNDRYGVLYQADGPVDESHRSLPQSQARLLRSA